MAAPLQQLITTSINLTTVLTRFAGSSTVQSVSRAIISWLAVEKVDDKQMLQFCELARNKAHPNQHGYEALRGFNRADESMAQRLQNTAISLISGTTLARLVAKDPELAYIVTTTAVLAHYHGPEHIASTLQATLLDGGQHENGVQKLEYHWASASLGALTSKIVNSIFLNTCNASTAYNIPSLPLELQGLGKRTLEPRTFAAVTHSITSSSSSSSTDIFVRSDYFFADLTHWLYFHFHGIIKIVKHTTILLEETRGASGQTITLLIAQRNPNDAQINESQEEAWIEVSVASSLGSGTYRRILRDDFIVPAHGRSWLRKDFCELDDFVRGDGASRSALLSDQDDWYIKYTASLILSWILKLPASPLIQSRLLYMELGDLAKGQDYGLQNYSLQDFFPCSPRLLHEGNRGGPRPDRTFRTPFDRTPCERENSGGLEDRQTNVENLLLWFPSIETMMDGYQRTCLCEACLKEKSLHACKPGCKREEAVTRLLLLLARGFSDAMGGIDASGDGDVLEQKVGTLKLLYSIIEHRSIHWDGLFELVASVLSGVRATEVFYDPVEESSSWVALQNGSFVVLARWIDLKKERHHSQVFALEIQEGARIEGVVGEIGTLRGEGATTNLNHIETNEDGDAVMDAETILELTQQPDTCKLEFQTPIFHIQGISYRLLTVIRAGRFIRNVDTTLAVLGYLARLEDRCTHARESETISKLDDKQIVVVDFDRALGTWGFATPQSIIQTTKLLRDPLKVNAMLSAAPEGCVLRHVDRWCFDCALEYLEAYAPDIEMDGIKRSSDEYWGKCLRIINVSTRKGHSGEPRPKKRYLED